MKRFTTWGAASVSMSVLFSCSSPRAPSPAAPLPVAPLANATVTPTAQSTPRVAESVAPATGPSRDVVGYLGKQGILGTIAADGSHWSGSFHFADDGREVALEGTATAPEPDPDVPPDEPVLDGRKVHSYLACRFTATAANAVIDEASCLNEPSALEIDGTWSVAKVSEPFFLRTLDAGAVSNEDYYAAMLATPTSKHECPPFVETLSLHERDERATISYRLRWPCEHQSDEERYAPNAFGVSPRAAAPSFEAYVADFTQATPHQRLWSEQWATLADPDDPNEVSLRFAVLDFAAGLELYVASMSDDFQSPTSSGGNSTEQVTVWVVSPKGRYGTKLDLPASVSGHGGWCIASSKSSEAWLLDLDRDKVPEIVVRITESGRHDGVGKDGKPECFDTPAEVKFAAYRLNPSTLSWTQAPAPRGLSEQRLSRGNRIEL